MMHFNPNPFEEKFDSSNPKAIQEAEQMLTLAERKTQVEREIRALKFLNVYQREDLERRLSYCLNQSSVDEFVNTVLSNIKKCFELAGEAEKFLKTLEPYDFQDKFTSYPAELRALFFYLPQLSAVESFHGDLQKRFHSLGLEKDRIETLKKKSSERYKRFLLDVNDLKAKLEGEDVCVDVQRLFLTFNEKNAKMLKPEGLSLYELECLVKPFIKSIEECYKKMKEIEFDYRPILMKKMRARDHQKAVEAINALDLTFLTTQQSQRLMTTMQQRLAAITENPSLISEFIKTELPEIQESFRLAFEAKKLLKELGSYELNSPLVNSFNNLFTSSSIPKPSEVLSCYRELQKHFRSKIEKIEALKKQAAEAYNIFMTGSNSELKKSSKTLNQNYADIVAAYESLLKKPLAELEDFVPRFISTITCYSETMERVKSNYDAISIAEKMVARLKALDQKNNYYALEISISALKQNPSCDQTSKAVTLRIAVLEKMLCPLELREKGKNLIEELVKFESDEAERVQARASYQISLDEAYVRYNENDNPNSLDVFVKNLENILQKEQEKEKIKQSIQPAELALIREYATRYIEKTVARLGEAEQGSARRKYIAKLSSLYSREAILEFAGTLRTSVKEAEQKEADDLASQKKQLQLDIVPIDGSIQSAINDLVALERMEKNKYRDQLEKRLCIATEEANETVSLKPLENFLAELTAELSATQERARKLEELGLVTTVHTRRVDEETKQTPVPAASGKKFFASVAGLFKKSPTPTPTPAEVVGGVASAQKKPAPPAVQQKPVGTGFSLNG